MKTIIVPIDFSEQSEYALKAAASLSKKHGAEIIALHMLELNEAMISSSEGFHPEQTVFLIKMAEKRISEFLNKPYLKDVKNKKYEGYIVIIGYLEKLLFLPISTLWPKFYPRR